PVNTIAAAGSFAEQRLLQTGLVGCPAGRVYPPFGRTSRLSDRAEPDAPALLFYATRFPVQRSYRTLHIPRTGAFTGGKRDRPVRRRGPDHPPGRVAGHRLATSTFLNKFLKRAFRRSHSPAGRPSFNSCLMAKQQSSSSLGNEQANYPVFRKDGCHFTVWAPEKKAMTLRLLSRGPADTDIAMAKDREGYFTAWVADASAGDRCYYIPEGGKQCPDPGSQSQPEGVHGPSQIIDHRNHVWQDITWRGRPLSSMIFYELHVGTFAPEGTFDAIIPRLDDLAALGITAIQLMPVAECPGERNWGYDGVFLYAVQHNYGGPEGLKRLVDACHRRGISVFLDVVYNHLGKEGSCLDSFAPFFSTTYSTPWGKALNFDGPWCGGVRQFIIGNALNWARHYHLDGLRLDAVHEIYDRNAVTLWDELHDAIRDWEIHSGRPFYLIAESDLNDPRVVRPTAEGGRGFNAQWLDDFHHALYVLLDEDGWSHYQDYGELRQLAKAFTDGFVHSGEYVHFRHRRHGSSSAGMSGEQFVVFSQNHDIPGNRPDGARLSAL